MARGATTKTPIPQTEPNQNRWHGTQLEEFLQYHASEGGKQVDLVRHFDPGIVLGPVNQHEIHIDGYHYATARVDEEGRIVHMDFEFTPGGHGPDPVPMLVATINWLLEMVNPPPPVDQSTPLNELIADEGWER